MKLGLVAAASALAVATTQVHATVETSACSLSTILMLTGNPSLLACTLATGFNILSTVAPSLPLINSMCACDACLDYYEAIRDKNCPNCVVAGAVCLVTDILTPIDTNCYEDYYPDGNDTATMQRRRIRN